MSATPGMSGTMAGLSRNPDRLIGEPKWARAATSGPYLFDDRLWLAGRGTGYIVCRLRADRTPEMPKETIAIASDHAGFELKAQLKQELVAMGFEPLDLGDGIRESVDYPDFADRLAGAVKDGKAKRGVLVCGTGIGISMAANRHRHIRAGRRARRHQRAPDPPAQQRQRAVPGRPAGRSGCRKGLPQGVFDDRFRRGPSRKSRRQTGLK